MGERKNRTDLVFTAIVDHLDRTGISPTIREIQTATAISSSSVVDYNLGLLEQQGRITRRHDGSNRTIRLTGTPVPPIALEGKQIALRIIENAAQAAPDNDVEMVVDAALLFQLQRWVERVGA